MIRCLIVDDEPQARKLLTTYLSEITGFEIVGVFQNAILAYEFLKSNPVDLLFLDVQMPKLSGIEFLKTLKDPPLVILTTAFSDYALEGYDLSIVDYLLKPISFHRFIKAVDKVKQRMENGNFLRLDDSLPTKKFVFIKVNGKMVRMQINEIVYVEGMQNYVNIFLLNGQNYITFSKMKFMEQELNSSGFLRVHKSYLIQTSFIKEIKGNVIVLDYEDNCKEIPIGLQFKNKIAEYVRSNGLS